MSEERHGGGNTRWRRPRALKRQLAFTLAAVAMVSVALAGVLNYAAARTFLDRGTEAKLATIAGARAKSIETGLENLLGRIASEAGDAGAVAAFRDIGSGYAELGIEDALNADQLAQVDELYEGELLEKLVDAGFDGFTPAEARPASDAGLYVQYHYTAANPFAPDNRAALNDAQDGSEYSAAHARHHPYLRSRGELLEADDLMFVSTDTQQIIYSVQKNVDLGADLSTEAYSRSALADTVLEQLPRVRAGDAVFVDFDRYLPAGGSPKLFVAAAVRDDTEVLGAIVVALSVETLNEVTTAQQRWTDVGLGETGETYVVGPDKLLRSESRTWIEDPQAYLDQVDDPELAKRIDTFGSPILFQDVDTKAVNEALQGTIFEGRSSNYLGERRLSVARPIDVPGVDWIGVTDIGLGEARAPLQDFLERLILVLLVVLPSGAMLGIFMARRLTVPVQPILDAAVAVTEGDRDPEVPDDRSDEFGDLARRLKRMSRDLETKERALKAEYEQKRELLLTVLPPRLVGAEDARVTDEDVVGHATAISVTLAMRMNEHASAGDEDSTELRSMIAKLADELAGEFEIDRIRSAADSHLFVATAQSSADEAMTFVTRLLPQLRDLGAESGHPLQINVGLSSGTVGTGVLHQGTLTFGAWGEPIRRALSISALAVGTIPPVKRPTMAMRRIRLGTSPRRM
ncbi:MAG: HAMP domain-containing protein, partial [Acidobacteria bacterium]|nr:HAMP domain-containing protein [Acidobacteriota bacterium]